MQLGNCFIIRITCLIFIYSLLGLGRSVVAQDHLVPDVGMMYASQNSYNYCSNINNVFFQNKNTPYWCRMFCRPGFSNPQWCVTIIKRDGVFLVEYIESNTFIDSNNESRKSKIKIFSRQIDEETATAAHDAFLKLLRGTRYSEKNQLGGDGDEYLFSRNITSNNLFDNNLNTPPVGSEQGLVFDPAPMSKTALLVDIGKQLVSYAKSDSEPERKVIIKAVRDKSAFLSKF